MRARATSEENARWLTSLQDALGRSGKAGADAVRYLRGHLIRLEVRPQTSGARWTLDRRIEINPQYIGRGQASTYALSLVLHEIRHLQQGPITALSVYGELDAWRLQFGFLRGLRSAIPGSKRQQQVIQQLTDLPRGWSREALGRARRLMREYAGAAYRIDLLPLFPLHLELIYAITRRIPGGR